MNELRYAVIGCGFWSQFQIAGWQEVGGVKLVGVYNRTTAKAHAIARRFGNPTVYEDPETMLARERPDFVDIITDVDTHAAFVTLAARLGVPTICQKPMAPDLSTARTMVQTCRQAGVPFMVHENFRWQQPIRRVKALMDERLGRPFRARLTYSCSFPVFDNQPFLRRVERFVIADIGSHLLDMARFLFGEVRRVFCQTTRVTPGIAGEDVATVMLETLAGATVVVEMSYASRLEHERFPRTYLLAECEGGSIELAPEFWIRLTDADGTHSKRCPPKMYPWTDPTYDVAHASIVDCNRDLLRALRDGRPAETDGADNLKTMELVAAAYDSARTAQPVAVSES